ncbi:MAG: glycosyltransferase family 4 protein [Phycisphaeraceae bacterium]|nr:glycosyltransferase family 4 protein [Phycisphaeraceae bacterium]
MMGTDNTLDILLSQRFVPEQGGSIRWMVELCRFWPGSMRVVTHDYGLPPDDAQRELLAHRPELQITRNDILLDNWGLDRPGRIVRYWRMMRAVKRTMAGHRGPVRLHCTHAVPEVVSLLPLKARLGRRMRIICYAHGEEITACMASRQLRWLYRMAARRVDLMLANSRFTEQLVREVVGGDRIRRMNPGVNVDEFRDAVELGRAWRSEHGLEDRILVLTLGRLDERKNQAGVLRAIARIAERHPRIHYLVAGGGRQEASLRSLSEDLALNDRVSFLGPVDGVQRRALFGACDVFAMPAIQVGTDVEGFGLVFLEAGACGKPSIAGDSGGQADAVGDGQSGLVVDGRSTEAISDALDRLLSDAPLRDRMGEAARARALEGDWRQVVQRTWELVEEMN